MQGLGGKNYGFCCEQHVRPREGVMRLTGLSFSKDVSGSHVEVYRMMQGWKQGRW